jgi:hypothetical protein
MDLPAKAKVMGLGGASAYYGCFYCELRGTYIENHVYLTEPPHAARQLNDLQLNYDAGRLGIRELPMFLSLRGKSSFDPIFSSCIDVMHGVCTCCVTSLYGSFFHLIRSLWECRKI